MTLNSWTIKCNTIGEQLSWFRVLKDKQTTNIIPPKQDRKITSVTPIHLLPYPNKTGASLKQLY